ncbi:hypothetical protein H4W80_001369 [Nonomuraea angiospora]|uniref:Uncharacterized protein n=1 Tax=Nonomuraea angiospora TaxID=46172 RepID=A0ABR9LR27_9ACTN|nr:hypothetical protein [Nonomuraea angiospora]
MMTDGRPPCFGLGEQWYGAALANFKLAKPL